MFTTYVGGNFGRVKMSNKDVTEVVGIENVNLVIDIGLILMMMVIQITLMKEDGSSPKAL